MSAYQIRFIRSNGDTSIIQNADCRNDLDAKAAAKEMSHPDFVRVEIWRGLECIYHAPDLGVLTSPAH